MAIQFTCPYCHKEFPYNNGKIDADISNLKQQVTTLDRRLVELKLYYQTPEIKKERDRLITTRLRAVEKLTELKAFRKSADEHRRNQEYELLKVVVRDKYGEDEFSKLIEERDELMKAYDISGTMKHAYTRSNHLSSVTNINKL